MTDATAELEALEQELTAAGPLATFPWHRGQIVALSLATDTVVILGGSRSGKTQAALGIIHQLVRRGGPIYRRLRNPHNRPLTIWCCPQQHEKFLSLWEPRLREDVFAGIPFQYVESPKPCYTWDDGMAKGNTLRAKSQEESFLSFESDAVDLCVFDEEIPDRRLYYAAQTRTATTHGVVVCAFTPLLGMSSWTRAAFYDPIVRPEFQVMDRVWIRGSSLSLVQLGAADNPATVAGGGVARIQNDPSMTEAEKRTRLFGEYAHVTGAIFPMFADLRVEA